MFLQPACAGCPLTQEAVFKTVFNQWKIKEESSSTGGGWGRVLSWWVRKQMDRASAEHLVVLLSFSVTAASNLFACLCQCRLRSSYSARSELIDPNSASNNISLCHPPHPHIELYNLPLLSFLVKISHSCTAPSAATTFRIGLHQATVDV